jgi:hypothetical protein
MRRPSLPSRRRAAIPPVLAVALVAALPGIAAGHDNFDHPAFSESQSVPLSTAVNSGGREAEWELITSVPTGNPQTDIEFFTREGETYAAVGTLAVGPNGGGQTIIQLTQEGEVDPAFHSAHPSAFCPSNPRAALGLQHDVEATPKGAVINNSSYLPPVVDDAQLIVDATDNEGRCHDQGVAGVSGAPQGGLEIIDVTDPANPVEIGLTSHIGEAHTVNIDPKRPHIAYAVTSDQIGVVTTDDNGTPDDPSDDTRMRNNENATTTDRTGQTVPNADRFNLDGFEVVDMSSCMTEPYGTLPEDATVEEKRASCQPEVFRYRYPTLDMSLGHTTTNAIFGCHELEIYPDDRLTCGSGAALIVFDMSGAFDDNGTPEDFTDDKPVGEPLPCFARESSTEGPTATGATVIDCVNGGTADGRVDLTIPNWLGIGSPSLEGVTHLGSVHHMGRGGTLPSTEDVDFNHEAELTQSGDFLLATDERGGGVVPPGATCSPGADNTRGNGGVHAYQVDELDLERPETVEEAQEPYAIDPNGGEDAKAIFRAPIRTGPEASFCTAHVMQQIPGQNRIFMGWYSQGTQVIDYVELPDGRFEFVEDDAEVGTEQAGFFIPENANEWVSHIFRVDENDDGTFTYFGATGDFNFGTAGRNTIDVYKVTLPEPADACDIAPEVEGFTDFDQVASVHLESVNCALHYGISNGTSETTYTPDQEVTRAQMASFLVNTLESAGAGGVLPESAGDAFSDIAGNFARDDINRLAAAGVLSGRPDGTFDPRGTVSRAQMATFIVQTLELAKSELTATRDDYYGDVPSGSTHEENVSTGFEQGLFRGTTAPDEDQPGSGVFDPELRVPRDQMATFLVELFQRSITQ